LTPFKDLPRAGIERTGINLLTVGCLWDIEEAKTHAKELIAGLQLAAPRMLVLAREFAVHEWVEPALKILIPSCIDLTSDDALLIGPITLNILFQAKHEIDKERVYIAYTPGKLKDEDELNYGDCDDHKRCERVWKEAWWNYVGKKVLHPTAPLPLASIGGLLSRISIPGMTPKCHEDAIARWTTYFFEEDEIMKAVVRGVLEFHKYFRPS
jgi:hypothetical protein